MCCFDRVVLGSYCIFSFYFYFVYRGRWRGVRENGIEF